MVYNPTIWINDDGTGTVGTPVIASYMNNLEQGVKNNEQQINVLSGGDVKSVSDIGVTDANNLPIGWYSGNLSNSPTTDWYTYHTFNKLGDGYRTQIAYGVNTNRLYHRIYLNDRYQKWIFLGDDYTEIINSDLRNGFTVRSGFKCYVSRSSNNVSLVFNLMATNAGAGTIIAQLPDGFRPFTPCGGIGCYGNNSKTFSAELSTNGELRFWDLSGENFTEGEFVRLILSYRTED